MFKKLESRLLPLLQINFPSSEFELPSSLQLIDFRNRRKHYQTVIKTKMLSVTLEETNTTNLANLDLTQNSYDLLEFSFFYFSGYDNKNSTQTCLNRLDTETITSLIYILVNLNLPNK